MEKVSRCERQDRKRERTRPPTTRKDFRRDNINFVLKSFKCLATTGITPPFHDKKKKEAKYTDSNDM